MTDNEIKALVAFCGCMVNACGQFIPVARILRRNFYD